MEKEEIVDIFKECAKWCGVLVLFMGLVLIFSRPVDAMNFSFGECQNFTNATNETFEICAPAFPMMNQNITLNYSGIFSNATVNLTVTAPPYGQPYVENITNITYTTNTTYIYNVTNVTVVNYIVNTTNITYITNVTDTNCTVIQNVSYVENVTNPIWVQNVTWVQNTTTVAWVQNTTTPIWIQNVTWVQNTTSGICQNTTSSNCSEFITEGNCTVWGLDMLGSKVCLDSREKFCLGSCAEIRDSLATTTVRYNEQVAQNQNLTALINKADHSANTLDGLASVLAFLGGLAFLIVIYTDQQKRQLPKGGK